MIIAFQNDHSTLVFSQATPENKVSVWFILLVALSFVFIQGVPEQTAQSLMHRNFTTMSHRVVRFLPKCSEII